MKEDGNKHFPSLTLDLNLMPHVTDSTLFTKTFKKTHLVRRNQIRLEIASPLQRPFDPLFRIIEFPFRRTHVTWDRVRVIYPLVLPRVVRVCRR